MALQGPKEDHRATELRSIAKSIVVVFPDAAASLRAIAGDMDTEMINELG